MQLAPTTAAVVTPYSSHASTDVVSPTRLMTIAKERFNVALRIIGTGDTSYAPTALAASTAISEATKGVGALQSMLVPSTPWGPRQRGSASMTAAKRALTQLEQYRASVVQFGERPLDRSSLPVGLLAALDIARSSMRLASRHLP